MNKKPVETVYTLEPFRIFHQIHIHEDEKGFRCYIQLKKNYAENYVFFENLIIGVFGYINNKDVLDKACVYFKTYDDCVLDIEKLTIEYLDSILESKLIDKNIVLYKR